MNAVDSRHCLMSYETNDLWSRMREFYGRLILLSSMDVYDGGAVLLSK